MDMLSSFSKLAALSLTLAVFGAGCVAEVRPTPAYAVYGDYESYPRTVHRGRTVYYFDGGWHYRSGRRWVYVDEEPELYQYRTRSKHVRNAPGAYHPRSVRPSRPRPEEHRREEHRRYEEHRRSAPSAE
jgi:hypothetical protein